MKVIERLFRPRICYLPEARHHLVNESPALRAKMFQIIDDELAGASTPAAGTSG